MTLGKGRPQPVSGTISDVQIQRRSTARRSIFVDGEFAFGVSEEAYQKFYLTIGKKLTEEFVEDLLGWENYYQARIAAMRHLHRRRRSVYEITKNLTEKGFDANIVKKTLVFLDEYNYIDDEEFAKAFVHDRLLKRPFGRKKLSSELRSKGIADEIIHQTLDEHLDRAAELAQAYRAAKAKEKTIKQVDRGKWERSMSSFLENRGFDWSIIREVLRSYREE